MPLPASQGTPGIPWLWQQNSTLCFRVPWHLRSLCVSPIFILQGHHPIRVGPPHLKLTASANTLLPNMVIFISTRFFFSMSLGGHNSTHNSSFVRSGHDSIKSLEGILSRLASFPQQVEKHFVYLYIKLIYCQTLLTALENLGLFSRSISQTESGKT